jgi:excisionase family DNA binding protein
MSPSVSAYTISDFIETFRLGRTKVYAEIKAGRLKARKVGKRTLVLKTDAEAWLSSLPVLGGDDSG